MNILYIIINIFLIIIFFNYFQLKSKNFSDSSSSHLTHHIINDHSSKDNLNKKDSNPNSGPIEVFIKSKNEKV